MVNTKLQNFPDTDIPHTGFIKRKHTSIYKTIYLTERITAGLKQVICRGSGGWSAWGFSRIRRGGFRWPRPESRRGAAY